MINSRWPKLLRLFLAVVATTLIFGTLHVFDKNQTFVLETPDFINASSNQQQRLDLDATNPPPDKVWLPVDRRRLLLKSSFAEMNQPNLIRVLAQKDCDDKRKVVCTFYSNFWDNYATATGSFEAINAPVDAGECVGNKIDAFYLYCPLPPLPNRLTLLRPTFVSISAPESDPREASKLLLPIQYVPKPKTQFAFCIAPLGDWTDTNRLILFFEYYISQGADLFLVYYFSSSPDVVALLDHYKRLGVVEVIPWPRMPNFPKNSSDGTTMKGRSDDPNAIIHYRGQILSMNDCLWRLRARAAYAALVDLDEFIVPFRDETILDLLLRLDEPSIGGFMFLSSFVGLTYPWIDSTQEFAWNQTFNFSGLRVFRDRHVHPPEERSKVIVKPRAVHKQTVHLAWRYLDPYKCFEIPKSVSLMYHIRHDIQGHRGVEDTLLKDLWNNLFK